MDIVDVVPISDLRVRQQEVLGKIQKGPVVLAQRSRPGAVLLSWQRWRELVDELELLPDTVEAANTRTRLGGGEDTTINAEDYIASRGGTVSVAPES